MSFLPAMANMVLNQQITSDKIRQYAAAPMAFFAETIIPRAMGDVALGNCWADFQIEAFKVFATCVKAVAAGKKPPYRGLWIERTKGASKDSDVGLALLWLLMFARRPQLIELGADDQSQILETYKAMAAVVRANHWMQDRVTVRRNTIVCEATSSECIFLTRDETGAHGSRPTVTVCNELSHVNGGEFIATMLDNADKIPNNLVIIATNAGELTTWQHKWRENYRTSPSWWFQKVDGVAPWIDADMVADAERRNPPARFKRLWRGMWVSPGGDALPAEAIEKCIVHSGACYRRENPPYNLSAIGVDAGLQNHHAAVVVLFGSYWQQKLRVAKVIDLAPPVKLEAIRDVVLSEAQRFKARFVAVDPWQMMRVAEELVRLGLIVEAQHQTGQVITRQAAALLEAVRDGTLELYDDSLLIEDLYSCKIVERSYGHKLELLENEHGHGDRLAALCNVLPFALQALPHAPRKAITPLRLQVK
jgi:hypothetical protein